MRKYVCSDLKIYHLYSRIETSLRTRHLSTTFSSRRLAAAATFHIGNFVAAAIKIIGFLPSSSSSPSSSPCPSSLVSVGGPRLRKFALPTPRSGHWPTCENMCTGNLTRSGLRKYALRQNHTIPVCARRARRCLAPRARSARPSAATRCATREGGHFQRTTSVTYDTRVQSKIHSLADLAAARATCRLAAAARRSQARRGSQPTQDAVSMPDCSDAE